ncbi:disease resistance protein At4g27190-like [Rhodamnia argentea]|uniref:Disease resistance protein At4g27190-like n=1 Tax=Rhodamnia argentea TaxID=178133 RepID=A0ABM3HGI7_9MYRT|nr:disease resistance protein At4g27190-like [Rhodamnia argentea]
MSMDSVVSIGWDVLKWVVVPVKRQFGYVISSKSYAQDLQQEVGKLAYEAEMVHNAVEVARNNCRNVYSHVMEWQAKAEKALKEAGELLGEFEKASKRCCYGTLPDPNCRYQFSRKAKDKIELLQGLARECSEFRDISFIDPAPGNVTAASAPSAKDDGVFESRASIKRKIIAALADNRNSVVGVHGMGGTGKSTLLEEVERRIREERSFDLVAKADVSENPDIKRIQEEIAYGLGLSDIKQEENVSLRAKLLRERLEDEERTKQENDEGKKKKKKVLIILDNLWKGLDLKSVGIPCGHDNKVIGCKLLLTSRFQDVLRREMGCDRDFLLDALKEEEAKRLFERTVGDKVHHDPFKSLVDEALNKCAGLPFLIIAMANVFRDADFREWKDVLRQIEMSTNKGIDEKINEMLRLSYNRFKGEDGKEVTSLLRLCVVYGVSKPSLENLVRYGVGSRLFREDSSMEEVRDRLSSLIQTLKASSFLLADETDADVFKIHDLVRGFVASVASRDDPLLVLKNHDKSVTELPKDKLKSCTSVCFPYVDMEELPEELDCPEMRIFLLFTNNESLKVPVSCFNSMRKLMVLHLSRVRLTRSPSPFQFLENLHTLCLNDCSLEDVAMISELKRLCVLSFANSKIQRLPKEIGQLVELRLLDLNHCSKLEMIEPGVLGSLMKLEELYMENSFDRWNAVEQTPPTNAGLIELNKLKNLYTLHVSILDPSVLPEDLNVEKLTKYQIRIGDVPCQRIRNGSSILELTLDPISDILQKGCIQTLLGKTDDLFLGGLNGIEQTICVLSQKGFSKLKHLQVKNSSSVHYVLQSPSHTEFKMLESLLLDNLINLEKICNNHISSNSFNALKVVRVENCNKMEVLFPLSLLRELPQLEEMRVVECHLMREIVEVDDSGKVELRNLRALELRDLPNIKNFVTNGTAPSSSTSNDQVGPQIAFFNGQQVAFPSLETLRIWFVDSIDIIWDKQVVAESFRELKSLSIYGCDKLGLSKLKRVWDKELHSQVKFQCLHSVTVSRCDSLTSLFPASLARDLMQLEELKMNECGGIVELIEKEGLVPRDVFPKLTSLELNHLPELKCIYTGTHALRWPALKTLKMDGYNKVEIFASQPENEMPLHKQPLFLIEKGAFSNLQELKLDLCGRMELWHGHSHGGEFFCKVRVLELRHFSKESAISTCRLVRSLANLQELVVRNSDIEELSNIVEAKEGPRHELKVIPPFSRSFQHLKTLDVSFCDGLSKMFTPTIAGNLAELTKLRISKCKMLTEIICDDGGEEGLVVVFNQLKYMELDGLTGLRFFSSSKCTLMFPLLEDVIVSGCPSMKFFSEGPINTPKLERLQASTEAWLRLPE